MTEPRAHTWRCNECNEPIAKPHYVRDYVFCSEPCRQAFLAQSGVNVPAIVKP